MLIDSWHSKRVINEAFLDSSKGRSWGLHFLPFHWEQMKVRIVVHAKLEGKLHGFAWRVEVLLYQNQRPSILAIWSMMYWATDLWLFCSIVVGKCSWMSEIPSCFVRPFPPNHLIISCYIELVYPHLRALKQVPTISVENFHFLIFFLNMSSLLNHFAVLACTFTTWITNFECFKWLILDSQLHWMQL